MEKKCGWQKDRDQGETDQDDNQDLRGRAGRALCRRGKPASVTGLCRSALDRWRMMH